MSKPHDIAVLVGSLRAGSLNRRVAQALIGMAPASIALEIVEIGDLPFYNADLETDSPPPAWTRFRERISRADGLLFVTPEYNRSVPAVLKNAIDVGSRPTGQSVFGGRPGAVISASPGAIGGFGANHHVRQSLVPLNVPLMQTPEAYLGGADKFFDDDGKLANEGTAKFLGKLIHAYADWVARFKA